MENGKREIYYNILILHFIVTDIIKKFFFLFIAVLALIWPLFAFLLLLRRKQTILLLFVWLCFFRHESFVQDSRSSRFFFKYVF